MAVVELNYADQVKKRNGAQTWDIGSAVGKDL